MVPANIAEVRRVFLALLARLFHKRVPSSSQGPGPVRALGKLNDTLPFEGPLSRARGGLTRGGKQTFSTEPALTNHLVGGQGPAIAYTRSLEVWQSLASRPLPVSSPDSRTQGSCG